MVQGLGERLQQKRSSIKLSQKEVANAVGVNPSVISNYENGERTPGWESVMEIQGNLIFTVENNNGM